jgi:hypothetical protein
MTHFVVILPYVDAGSSDITKAITTYFKDKGFAFWHWSNECWLLTSIDDTMDAVTIRTAVSQFLVPGISFLVLRVELPASGINWATQGPLASKQKWPEWLRAAWEAPIKHT